MRFKAHPFMSNRRSVEGSTFCVLFREKATAHVYDVESLQALVINIRSFAPSGR